MTATPRAFDSQRWPRALVAAPPIFVRSLFFGAGPHALIEKVATGKRPDRLTPLLALLDRFRAEFPLPGLRHATRGRPVFTDVRLETPDTNEGKALSGLTRSLAARLEAGLVERGAMLSRNHDAGSANALHLHVLFTDGANVLVGASAAPWASPWLMGIPRLHMPRAAPSRSALKLAEAFVTFLGAREGELVGAGMRAVDLGAAPGGWTWQLAQRGLRVIAVDNARLKGGPADDPLVTHVRADGLSFRPRRPVDWLVCDIVDQPERVAAAVAGWMADGAARHAIFNLKLPMKKRYDEVVRCERLISERLARTGTRFELRLKQLYHDREEVTGYCARLA